MDGRCVGATCLDLRVQSFNDANKCVVNKMVNEDTDGCKFILLPEAFYLTLKLVYLKGWHIFQARRSWRCNDDSMTVELLIVRDVVT